MSSTEFFLQRDCPATLVPVGDSVTLEKGTKVTVTQSRGGTVTVMTARGLFHLGENALDALGENAVARFAKKTPATPAAGQPFSIDTIWATLRECYDPEIPLNLVDLGLIYDLALEPLSEGKNKVFVKMTLTSPTCGMGPAIAESVKDSISALPEVGAVELALVWEPVWTPDMISSDGRKELGLE